ncbi:hypothetical protein A2U01_0047201, partial [Trifolium medium]|nr:hypothetical protein [Trifolium medium]
GAKDSIWWKDVMGIGRSSEEKWFKLNAGCGVGDGNNIGFWKFKWLRWNGDNLEWFWQWCEELSIDEEQQLHELKDMLHSFSIHPDRPDRWRWLPSSMGYPKALEERCSV